MSSNAPTLEGRSVLVTGATGMQGGAVARALARAGASVSALVRDPNSASAEKLDRAGIRLQTGDLDDYPSLLTACEGHEVVFSVQAASSPSNPRAEQDQADNLIHAARESDISQFVHSSVSGTGWRESHPNANSGGTESYWDSKEAVESAVRRAGFPSWTILKPAFFMDNLIEPKVSHMFPLINKGEILVACRIDTNLAMVSAEEFGEVVAAIAADPARFSEAEIELSSESLTFGQIASTYSSVTGTSVVASSNSPDVIEQRLGTRSWSGMQIWLESVGYPARPEHAAKYGFHLTGRLDTWLAKNR
ncbi:NmrA family NAD(P)-binding protein [Prescottella equi]